MKLYEISTMYQQFLASLEAGEIPEEAVADTLDGLDGVLEDKADSIACIIKDINADAVALREEEKALAERRKAKEAQAESLTQYLSGALLAAGKTKIETSRNKISFRKSARLVLDSDFMESLSDADKDNYLRYKEPEPNKTEITKALKGGAELHGAHLEDTQNIQIK